MTEQPREHYCLAGPWSYRKARTHFVVEAANGVRVAEVRYVGRPDGTTSESAAAAIAALPELAAAAENLLEECGFGRMIFDTQGSERLRAALLAVRGIRTANEQGQGEDASAACGRSPAP